MSGRSRYREFAVRVRDPEQPQNTTEQCQVISVEKKILDCNPLQQRVTPVSGREIHMHDPYREDEPGGEVTECVCKSSGDAGERRLIADGGERRKIVGEIGEEDAIGVHGKATGDGETYGVKGEVDSEDGYGLYTPDDVKVDGAVGTDNELEVYVGNDKEFELEQATRIFSGSPAELEFVANGNVIFGHLNEIDETVMGGVIAGGGNHDVDDDIERPNVVKGDFGTVSGGDGNVAGDSEDEDVSHATVGGGRNNEASGGAATVGGGTGNVASDAWATVGGGFINEASGRNTTVGGGWENEASGMEATIPGGRANTADGDYTFAAGREADTNGHDGAIVFGDSSEDTIEADADDTAFFQMPIEAPNVSNSSARALKTDIDPIDPTDVLDGVESLDVSTWRFDHRDTGLHMGPMAGEFAETFGLGDDDETIATVDADGVALAAIQGLSQKLDERDRRIDDLKARNDELDSKNDDLNERIEELEAKNEEFESRLTAVETSHPKAGSAAGDN